MQSDAAFKAVIPAIRRAKVTEPENLFACFCVKTKKDSFLSDGETKKRICPETGHLNDLAAEC